MKHIDVINNTNDLQNKIYNFIDEYFTSKDKRLLEDSLFRIDLCDFDSGTHLTSSTLGIFTPVSSYESGESNLYYAIFLRPMFKKTTANNTIAHELTHLACYLRHDITNNDAYRKNSGLYSGHGSSFFKIGEELFGKDYTVSDSQTEYDDICFDLKKTERGEWWKRFKYIFDDAEESYKMGLLTKTEKIEIQDLAIDSLARNGQDEIIQQLIG